MRLGPTLKICSFQWFWLLMKLWFNGFLLVFSFSYPNRNLSLWKLQFLWLCWGTRLLLVTFFYWDHERSFDLERFPASLNSFNPIICGFPLLLSCEYSWEYKADFVNNENLVFVKTVRYNTNLIENWFGTCRRCDQSNWESSSYSQCYINYSAPQTSGYFRWRGMRQLPGLL